MKRMKSARLLSVVALLLSVIFAAVGRGEEKLTQEEWQYLQTKGEIIFVSQTRYPPFEFVDRHGEHTGMSIELARWIATEFGFRARFTDAPFHAAQQAILSGRADVLTSLFYSEKRDERFDFTGTIFEVPAAIFVAADRPDIKGIEDLNGKTVAIQKGDYALDFLRDRQISFQSLDTVNFAEAADLAIAGRADAVVGDEQIILYHLYSNKLTDRLKKAGRPLYTGRNCMAVREKNAILQAILQKGVESARKKGVLDTLQRKWLGVPVSLEKSTLERYRLELLALFAALALLVVLVWFWNLQLRRRVAARTGELARSEGMLRESEQKYRLVVDNINVGMVVIQEGRLVFANRGIARALGYSPEELPAAHPDPFELVHPQDREMVLERYMDRIAGGGAPEGFRFRAVRNNGDIRWVEITGVRIDWDGKAATLNFLLDVTQRVQAEQAIRQSEGRFQDLFNAISDLIYTQDLEGRFLSVNPAITRLFGFGQEELIGLKAKDVMKPELISQFESGYLDAIKTNGFAGGTTCYLAKDGRKVYMEYRSALVKPEDGAPYISGVGRDVTERILARRDLQKLQEQVLQAKKMESIGVLAGGVAHDFNNLLMGIQGNASLLLLHSDPDSPGYERMKNIERYVEKGSELTRQLLGFARGGKYEVKPVDINGLIREGAEMFGRTRKEIAIHQKYQENVWTVEVDKGQIDQVMLNLYLNSGQAMPAGGDLSIGTENSVLDENQARQFGIFPGRYVKISVADTGAGMDEETRQRIFEPFFTTKEMGRGTGLGLASAYGIIKSHGGGIGVYSKKGEGTAFAIYLPATDAKVEAAKPEISEDETGSGATILLVDDEEMILDVGGEMINALGYNVISAPSGPEAVEIYRQNRGKIAMVILVMIMPGMGGEKTFNILKEMDPGVRVLLSSGYSIDGKAQAILDSGCRGFIQKPYRLSDLSTKIKEIIYC